MGTTTGNDPPGRRIPYAPAVIVTSFSVLTLILAGGGLAFWLCSIFAVAVVIALIDRRDALHPLCALGPIIIGLFASGSIRQWLLASIVLLGVTAAMLSLRFARLGGRLLLLLFLAWFAAPIYLAHAMLGAHGATIAAMLTRFHPLFALNRIFIDRGAWTSNDLAYRLLTPLGQDVAYTLPESILPCVLLHLGVTAVCPLLRLCCRSRAATVPC